MPTGSINTFNEKALHAALKEWYVRPGDLVETPVKGFIIDIARGDFLIEIQTRSFASIRRKLTLLLKERRVRLVCPVVTRKWVVRMSADGETLIGRRKSPRLGRIEDLFKELTHIPKLPSEPNFSLEALFVEVDEVRHRDEHPRYWRSKGWRVHEQRLLRVVESRVFETLDDFRALLSDSLPLQFTTKDLCAAHGIAPWLARKMAYFLRESGAIALAGKKGNSLVYAAPEALRS